MAAPKVGAALSIAGFYREGERTGIRTERRVRRHMDSGVMFTIRYVRRSIGWGAKMDNKIV